jgi:GAF domain-containing protein
MEFGLKDTVIPPRIVEIWQRIVDSAAIILSVPSVMINRLEPPDLEVFRSNNSSQNPFPTGTRMAMANIYCESAARRRQRVEVIDAREDPFWANSPTAKAGIFAYLGYPVFWPDGDVFGTLCAVDLQEKRWSKQADDLLHTMKEAIEVHLDLAMTMEHLNQKNSELELALTEVKTLQGLLPICAACKKIRDDQGYWGKLESYIMKHTDVQFSHGICPECAKKLYADIEF